MACDDDEHAIDLPPPEKRAKTDEFEPLHPPEKQIDDSQSSEHYPPRYITSEQDPPWYIPIPADTPLGRLLSTMKPEDTITKETYDKIMQEQIDAGIYDADSSDDDLPYLDLEPFRKSGFYEELAKYVIDERNGNDDANPQLVFTGDIVDSQVTAEVESYIYTISFKTKPKAAAYDDLPLIYEAEIARGLDGVYTLRMFTLLTP